MASALDRPALELLKQKFLTRFPHFVEDGAFQAEQGAYWSEFRKEQQPLIEQATEALQSADDDTALGARLLDLVRSSPALHGGIISRMVPYRRVGGVRIARAAATLARSTDLPAAAAAFAADTWPVMVEVYTRNKPYRDSRTIPSVLLALVHPHAAIGLRSEPFQLAGKTLIGKPIFTNNPLTESEYKAAVDMAEAIRTVMKDEWEWHPRDLWDVHGFIMATCGRDEGPDMAEDNVTDEAQQRVNVDKVQQRVNSDPVNLILYGPPGTGKTYATAERAVALCDEVLPSGREAIMTRYRELVDRKRISFVTFHQSYAYEDFVEGLRPETGPTGAEEPSGSGGFSLRANPGVFRRIAELARNNRGRAVATPTSYRDRQVFKMSLGRSGQEEGARIFTKALDGGYVVLGWGGDIDWSDPEYDRYDAIKRRWLADRPEATGNDPNITQLYAIRAGMHIGDLVIVSDGNKKFRAIGEVTGPYEFVASDEDEFHHRKPVRWLWRNDQGSPRELIYHRNFSQVSAYQLDSNQIDWPALEQIISAAGESIETTGTPEPYVLIIDEINRANISKVFGELITLIEPDKRLGAENALTVTLPYSGDTFGIPPNLHIIGTMNTADRSIALLDTALRRRFEFEELMPNPDLLGEVSSAVGVDLSAVLSGINRRIEYLFDREHQIGHAFFMGCRTMDGLNRVMRTKVIPLLSEYFYENWEKVRQVLCESTDEGAFIGRSELAAPAGGDAIQSDEARWRYFVRPEFSASAYDQLKS